MGNKVTASGRGRARRYPVIRVVPRIAYYQQRWNKDGTVLTRRLAVVGAEHIIKVRLRDDEPLHEQLGSHTFVMKPAKLLDRAGPKAKELRFRLKAFHHLLGLLPDWDYTSSLGAEYTDSQGQGQTADYTALVMLTVQRKRRERTIVLPVQRFDAAHSRSLVVALRKPNNTLVTTATLRLGGVDCGTVNANQHYVFTNAPKSTFILQAKPGTLPTGFALPKRKDCLVDLSDPNLPQPFNLVLRKT